MKLSVKRGNREITTCITHHHVIDIDMSKDSTQNIPQEATKLKKLAKVTARYVEMEEFKDSDHHTGYFCYNCIYFMKPNHCAIVTDEGPDVYDKSSGEIAPYGICALWEPNKEEMR
ncbi:MAG: hypothetical protein ACJ708_06220 [Nitrososphaeraceae archaeon]